MTVHSNISKKEYRDSKSWYLSSVGYIWTAAITIITNQQRSHMQIAILVAAIAFMFNRIQFSVWFRKMRFKDGFGALAFFLLLFFFFLFFFIVVIIISLWVCCAFLIYCTLDSLYFFIYLPYIHFTSQLYIQHTQKKPVSILRIHIQNGTFKVNWTQTTIRFIIFKQQQQQKKLKIIWLPLNQEKKVQNSIVVSRWQIIIIIIIYWIKKIPFNSHWIECVSYKSYVCTYNENFGLSECKILILNCSQLSIVLVCIICMCLCIDFVRASDQNSLKMPIKLLNVSFSFCFFFSFLLSAFLQNNVSCFFIRYNFYC